MLQKRRLKRRRLAFGRRFLAFRYWGGRFGAQFSSYFVKQIEFLSKLAQKDRADWSATDHTRYREVMRALLRNHTARYLLLGGVLVGAGDAAGVDLSDVAFMGAPAVYRRVRDTMRRGEGAGAAAWGGAKEAARRVVDVRGPGADAISDAARALGLVPWASAEAKKRADSYMRDTGAIKAFMEPSERPETETGERGVAAGLVAGGQAARAAIQRGGVRGAALAGAAGAVAGGVLGARTPPWLVPGGGVAARAKRAGREAEQGMELGPGGVARRPAPPGAPARRMFAPVAGAAEHAEEKTARAIVGSETARRADRIADQYADLLVERDTARRLKDTARETKVKARLKQLDAEIGRLARDPEARTFITGPAVRERYRARVVPEAVRMERGGRRDVRLKFMEHGRGR